MGKYKFCYLLEDPFEILLYLSDGIPVVSVSVFNILDKKPMFKIINNNLFVYIREFTLKISFKYKDYTIENKKNGVKDYGQIKRISFDRYIKRKNLIDSRENYLNEIYSKQSNIDIKYKYKIDENYNRIFIEKLETLGYSNIKNGDNVMKCINILNWISKNTLHNGSKSLDCNGKTMLEVMNLNKHESLILNCRGKAKMANEILMMEGIKSRLVFCKQYELYAINDHVIVIAYIKEIRKWIMLDPTYNLMIKSDKEGFLSIHEFRNYLLTQKLETLILSENINYNGRKLNKMIYFREMKRSFYRFTTTIDNYPGCDISGNFIGLLPNVDYINNVLCIDNPDKFWS